MDYVRKFLAMICEEQPVLETTPMSNTRRGLPLTSSRIEKIFPKLTPAQISRIAAHGHIRSVQSGEV